MTTEVRDAAAKPVFRRAGLFASAPKAALELLESSAAVVTVHAGEWLFRRGDSSDALYVVAFGRLRVVAEDDTTLRIVGPGSLLGELGVLAETQRSASVQAIRDSEVVELPAAAFQDLVARDASFAHALARELAVQLQQSGGLMPPAAAPAVFSVVAAGPFRSAGAFNTQLATAFADLGTTVALSAADAPNGAASAAAEAETRGSQVLLFADLATRSAWDDFALRQSDRTVLVTDGADDPPVDPRIRGADVVFLGAPQGRVVQRWVDAVGARAHHVVPAGSSAAVARVARRLTGRALGVVLSGGGARGFAHVGALQALRDAGFEPDRVGGCSIGSFIGAMAAVGWPAEQMETVCEAEFVRRAPFSDYTIPRVSLIRARRAAAMLERVFGDAWVEELERTLFTVSADLLASELVVHRRGRIVDAVGASMSIPGLAPPLPLGSRLLVDGGVLNNLPVDLMDPLEGPVVAIDVIRRMERAPAAEGDSPRLPSIMETLSRATVLGSTQRSERNRTLATLTIVPDVQDVGLREFGSLRKVVAAGRRAAEESLEQGGAEALRRALASR